MDNSLFFDLTKATIDKTKLVQVQRMVSRGGKTFPQNFWVSPSQVKSTDKVIGGQQNLLPKPGSVAKPAKGVWDKTYFDSITQNASDRSEAIQYLKDLGVTWNENAHAGINWMRAKQALDSFLAAQGGNSQPQVKTSPATNNTQQSAQNTVSSTQATPTPSQVATAASYITPQIQTELDKCTNGKEKVAVLKQHLGKAKTMEYAKALGVTWDENAHDAINNMRMSMALVAHFDTVDGTVSPTASSTKGGGAPKGNKNAQGNHQKNPDELQIPSNATQRQKNIINLINSITDESDLTNYAYIGMIPEDDVAKAFIMDKLVPKHKRWAAANASFAKKTGTKGAKGTTGTGANKRYNSNNSWGFADQMAYDMKFEGCKKDILGKGMQIWYDKFNMSIITDPHKNITPPFVSNANNSAGRAPFSTAGIFTTMRSCYSDYTTDEYTTFRDKRTYDYNTSQYVTVPKGEKLAKHVTNLGYSGNNPAEYSKNYDVEKEGFVRYLRKVAKDNPSSEVQASVDNMITKYDRMMQLVGGNPKLLTYIMHRDTWEDDPSNNNTLLGNLDRDDGIGAYSTTPAAARETVRIVELQYDLITNELKRRGCSDKSIYRSLSHRWNNDSMTNFEIYDDDDNATGEYIDFTQITDSSGNPFLDANNSNELRLYTKTMDYIRDRHVRETGIWETLIDSRGNLVYTPEYDSAGNKIPPISYSMDNVEAFRQLAHTSADTFKEVHKSMCDIFGMKLMEVDDNGNETPIDWSTTQVSQMKGGWSSPAVTVVPADDTTPADKLVLTNILMAELSSEANESIVNNITDNPRSKLNNNGDDYSGNFTFYSGSAMLDRYNCSSDRRGKQAGRYNSAVYTKDELSSQISSQLELLPNYTSDYIDQVSQYYDAKSGFTGSAVEAKKDTFNKVGIQLSEYHDNPIKDVLFNQMSSLAMHVPSMAARGKDAMDNLTAKRMDYVPFDFQSPTQHKLSDKKPAKTSTPAVKSQLRQLREEVYKAAHCTISTEDENTSLQMRKDFMKRWDYNNHTPETTPDGITVTSKKFDGHGADNRDRRALFNSRFFKVNNGNMEEDFAAYSQTASDSKPMELFSAGGYSSAGGILGVTGGWYMGSSSGMSNSSGQMLGAGAYFGYKGGKSWVYCGDNSYSMRQSYLNGDDGNGCYILATVIRGNNGDSTSDHGRTADFEICIHNNKCIFPHHFVDISARALNVNVRRDANGNYVDSTGKITHDKYGKSVTMK